MKNLKKAAMIAVAVATMLGGSNIVNASDIMPRGDGAITRSYQEEFKLSRGKTELAENPRSKYVFRDYALITPLKGFSYANPVSAWITDVNKKPITNTYTFTQNTTVEQKIPYKIMLAEEAMGYLGAGLLTNAQNSSVDVTFVWIP